MNRRDAFEPIGHAQNCGCAPCVRARVAQDVEEDLVEAMTDAVMDAEAEAQRSPRVAAEEALYARLTERMMGAMKRAGLREAQMYVVIDEFLAAAHALCDDVERFSKEEAERAEAARKAEIEEDTRLVETHLVCVHCRRDCGTHEMPQAMARYADTTYVCVGCQREGRHRH